jgi:glycosyltransferase involved in cell wall biosynthesis
LFLTDSKKIAFCMVPIIAGPYTFYKSLRKSLEPYGHKVLCVGCLDGTIRPDKRLMGDDNHIALDLVGLTLIDQIKKFKYWIEENNVEVLIINNANEFELTALPYLPSSVARVTMNHLLWSRGYRAVTTNLKYNDKIIVLNQRQRDTLIKQYSVPAKKIQIIPHGIELSEQQNKELPVKSIKRELHCPIQLLYLGRLEELQKAVLQLPKIVRYLKNWKIPYELTIIGDGEARPDLEADFRKYGLENTVKMLGFLPPEEVKRLLSENNYDVLLMPSRSEALSFALLEVMAMGIVPVASFIAKITDTIVLDGKNGFLCPIGSPKNFAQAVVKIIENPKIFEQMSLEAQRYMQQHFSLEAMGRAYNKLLLEITSLPPREIKDLRIDPPEITTAFRPTLLTRLPDPLKMWIRQKIYDVTGREL